MTKTFVLDCEYGRWGSWTGCENQDCSALGVRLRTITQQAQGGHPCNVQDLAETQSCAEILKCTDPSCIYSTWSTWSTCTSACFHGTADCNNIPYSFRTRQIIREAQPGGIGCDWATLIQTISCPTAPCPSDLPCIVANANPILDCDTCPNIGCTLSSQSFFVYCTRSLLQSQSGNGAPCQRFQLLYSQTCPLPDCNDQCNFVYQNYFAQCDQPCGPGFQVESASCPFISITNCNLGVCPAGTMQSTTFNTCAGTTISTCTSNIQTCLNQCWNNPHCNALVSNSTANYLVSATGCSGIGTNAVWQTNPASTDCIPINYDMVRATCLYLCEGGQLSFSDNRGLTFAFTNDDNTIPSLSCPITLDVLSFSGGCPIISSGPLPEFYNSFTSVYNPGIYHTLSCAPFQNCVYQPYKDAPVWSQCDASCQEAPIGLRQRHRLILSASNALGQPCDPYQLTEFVPCNISALTSASEMLCYSVGTSLSSVSEAQCQIKCSETGCNSIQTILYSTSNPTPELFLLFIGYSVTSLTMLQSLTYLQNLDPTLQLATYEDLSLSYNAGFQSCNKGWYQNTLLQVASDIPYYNEETYLSLLECPATELGQSIWVQTLTSQHINKNDYTCSYTDVKLGTTFGTLLNETPSCDSGYIALGSAICSRTTKESCIGDFVPKNGECVSKLSGLYAASEFNVASILIQTGCTFTKGLQLYTDTLANYMFVIGTKSNYPLALNFFTPYNTSPYSSAYTFTSQRYQDEISCILFNSRTDALLNAKSCVPFGVSQTSNMLFSNILDLPCSALQDCSLSNWRTDGPKCGTCVGLQYELQTRSIISQASEGGIPCSQFAQQQVITCAGPPCPGPPTNGFCIIGPASMTNTCAPNASSNIIINSPFIENWSTHTLFAFANAFGYIGATNTNDFKNLKIMAPEYPTFDTNGSSSMPINLAWMLNAQCLSAGGEAPICLPSITSTFGYDTNSVYYMQLNGNSFTGWNVAASCPYNIPFNSSLSQCIQSRVSTYPQAGSYVWSLSSAPQTAPWNQGTWANISICPYVLGCCAFPQSCSTCDNGLNPLNNSLTLQIPYIQGTGCSLPPYILTEPCPNFIPPCPTTQSCPIGCDGSPCNLATGQGSCSLSLTSLQAFYFCSCSNGSSASNCELGCAVSPINGYPCSGAGTCLSNGTCQCNPGFRGELCQYSGRAYIGLMEWLPYEMTQTYVYRNNNLITNYLSSSRIWSQGLSTNDENNLYGSLLQVTTTETANNLFTYYNPLLENAGFYIPLDSYTDNLIRFGNICVNDIDSSIGNLDSISIMSFLPSTWLQNPVQGTFSSLSCQEIPLQNQVTRVLPSIKYDILAEFNSHSSLPPHLVGKRFFLSCPQQNNIGFTPQTGGQTYTVKYQNPQQYLGEDDQPLFTLVNTLESYVKVCASRN